MDLKVRVAREMDQKRIKAFYSSNPSEFIVYRPECEINATIQRGHYFIVEEKESGSIVALSAIFYYDNDEHNLVELSDTLVNSEYRGLGLQTLLFKVRITYLIASHGELVRVSTAINSENKTSLQNQKKIGFVAWAPDKVVYSSCSLCKKKPATKPCCCDYFILPDKVKKEVVAKTLDVSKEASVLFKKEERQHEIFFDLRFLEGDLRDDLAGFAQAQ
jgi:RimJ/RimL family protein N-acetyltransferase